ncbi:MAG: hypothetical protein ACRC92_20705 [Peptostreptococcaceae bacterium]
MSKVLYWRELAFDNSVYKLFRIHNKSTIINSVVYVHITKTGVPPDNVNDSATVFTIPTLGQIEIKTEPGDRILYTEADGGSFSYHCNTLEEVKNYEIETIHNTEYVNGVFDLNVPKGATVMIQSDSKRNLPGSYLRYTISNNSSGEFTLEGAQFVSHTFTSDVLIRMKSEDGFYVSYMITASQNVSELSAEMQDKIDRLVANINGILDNMATKDMLLRVEAKTTRDKWLMLPTRASITNTVITSPKFYCKFAVTERDIEENSIIEASINIDALSSNLNVYPDLRGQVNVKFKFKEAGCVLEEFMCTNPILTDIISGVFFSLTNSESNININSRQQEMEIRLVIDDKYSGLYSGNAFFSVKNDDVPLMDTNIDSIVFNPSLAISSTMDAKPMYQNILFTQDVVVQNIVENLVTLKIDKEYTNKVSSFTDDFNDVMLPARTITCGTDSMIIDDRNDSKFLIFDFLKTSYPKNGNNKYMRPLNIEVIENRIGGFATVINLPLITESYEVVETSDRVKVKVRIQPLYSKGYTYLDNTINYFKTATNNTIILTNFVVKFGGEINA